MFRRSRQDKITSLRSLLATGSRHLLLLALLLVAFVITATLAVLGANRAELLRRAAIMHLRFALDREVNVGSVTFDPQGRITVSNLAVRDRDGRSDFLAVRRIDVRFDPGAMFRLPLRPAGAISAIDITEPRAVVTRSAAGRWNFQDLLEQESTPSEDRFRGAIRLHGGEIVYRDAKGVIGAPINEDLTDVTLTLSRASDDYMPFRFDAGLRSGRIARLQVSGGINMAARRLHGEVLHQSFDLRMLRALLPPNMREIVSADRGRADGRWQLLLDYRNKLEFTLTGLADLHDVDGTLRLPGIPGQRARVLPLHIASGQLAMTNTVIELIGIDGTVSGIPMRADGTLSGRNLRTIAMQVRLNNAPMAKLARVIPGLSELKATWGGTATGWAQLTGSLPDITVAGHVAGPAITVDKAAFTDLAGDFRFTGTAVTFTNAFGRGFGGSFTGNAWATVGTTPVFLFTGEARDIDSHLVATTFIPPPARPDMLSLHDLAGRVSGPVTVQTSGTDTMELIARPRGLVQLKDITGGMADASLHVIAHGKQAITTVERLTIDTPDGLFDLQGTVNAREQLDFSVRAHAVKLSHFAAMAQLKDIDGTGYVTGVISGTAKRPVFTGDFHAVKGHLATKPYSDLSGSLHAVLTEKPDMTMKNVRMISEGVRMEFAGALRVDNPETWEASATIGLPRTTLSALAKAAGVSLPLDGIIEGDVQLRGLPNAPEGSGRLVLAHPTLAMGETSVALESAVISFAVKGHTVTITNAELAYQGNLIRLTGTLSLDPATPVEQQLALHISAPSFATDSLIAPLNRAPRDMPVTFIDGDLCLPFDMAGTLAIEADVTAGLTPGPKETADQVVARTLRASATIRAPKTLEIAGVPFRDGAVAVAFDGKSRMLTLKQLTLTRDGSDHDYTLALTREGRLQLETKKADLGLALTAADGKTGADLAQLRQDALTMADNLCALPGLAEAVTALQAVPTPFGGAAALTVTLSNTLDSPKLAAALTLRAMTMTGNALPDVDSNITYDTASRTVTVNELALRGGADADATASLTGSVTLPVKDARGKEIKPGPMSLSLEAQNVDPSEIGRWLNIPALQAMKGTATIFASVPDTSTTAHPNVDASIEIANPVFNGVAFKALSATVTLDDDGIWIGRWVAPNTATPTDGQTPVRFAGRDILPDAASTLQFSNPNNGRIEPLQLYGYVPFRWKGPLSPDVPLDEPLLFYARLPKQGMDVVRAYAPELPLGNGVIDGTLAIGGTLRQLVLQDGAFHARIDEMAMEQADPNPNLPDRLKDIVVDLGFRSETTRDGRVISVVDLRDLSATYTRADVDAAKPAKKKEFFALRWLRALLNKPVEKRPFTPGIVVARGGENGAIRVDTAKLFTSAGALVPVERIPDTLQYDIYAKVLRARLNPNPLFQGTVTSYLHLGNVPATGRPLLEGNVYLESSRVNFGMEQAAPAALPPIPLNPDLQIGIWMGAGNSVTMEPENAIFSSSISANLPIVRTKLPFPFSPGEQQYLSLNLNTKPAINPDDVMHLGSWANRFRNTNFADPANNYGTVAWLEGTLYQPVFAARVLLEPNKSTIALPGGILTFTSAVADARFPLVPQGPDDQPRLFTLAKVTGTLAGYGIEGVIEGDLLKQDRGALESIGDVGAASADRRKLPITFTTVSAPTGAAPLTNDEIYSRLIGFSTLAKVLEQRDTGNPWDPLRYTANDWLPPGTQRALADKMGLATINMSLDPTTNALEATLITKTYTQARLGGYRFGLTTTFDTPQPWKLWVDYSLPNLRLLNAVSLRNFSLNAYVNDQEERSINLLWRREF